MHTNACKTVQYEFHFSEILIKIQTFSFKKMHLKIHIRGNEYCDNPRVNIGIDLKKNNWVVICIFRTQPIPLVHRHSIDWWISPLHNHVDTSLC